MSKIEELAERVDRLLVRHAEVQRTNVLLQQQVAAVTQERDSLRSRLNTARQRIDALLERLPQEPAPAASAAATPTRGGPDARIEPTLDPHGRAPADARTSSGEHVR